MNMILRLVAIGVIVLCAGSVQAQSGKGEISAVDARTGNISIVVAGRTQIYRTRASTQITVSGARAKITDLVPGMSARITSAEPGVATRLEAETAIATGAAPATTGPLAERLLGTTWLWGGNEETITFRPHGRIFWKGEERKDFGWKVKSESERVVEGVTPSGGTFKILFEADLSKGTVTTGNNVSRPTRLMTAK